MWAPARMQAVTAAAVPHSRSAGLAVAERRLQERLAGGAEQERPVERREDGVVEPGQEAQAVLGALGEADARVEDDALAGDAGRLGQRSTPAASSAATSRDHVAVAGRCAYMSAGAPAVVHQHERRRGRAATTPPAPGRRRGR